MTSPGTATEEVAGGAAVLVDPLDVDSIAGSASPRRTAMRPRLADAGRARAADLSGSHRRRDAGPPTARRWRRMTAELDVGVNLLWCRPAVGGSEEYLVRQLDGCRHARGIAPA